MKKEYTKPVVNGEVFVANEYVAACYKVQCTSNSGKKEFMYMTDDPTKADGFYFSSAKNVNSWYYTGTIAGCSPEYHTGSKLTAHYVVITDVSTPQNPNASV